MVIDMGTLVIPIAMCKYPFEVDFPFTESIHTWAKKKRS